MALGDASAGKRLISREGQCSNMQVSERCTGAAIVECRKLNAGLLHGLRLHQVSVEAIVDPEPRSRSPDRRLRPVFNMFEVDNFERQFVLLQQLKRRPVIVDKEYER